MRCLVSGAQGFIGTHLCRELQRTGHEVVAFEGDVTDPGAWSKQLPWTDRIFHLAGLNRGTDDELYETNVGGVHALVSVNQQLPVVFASSFQVYPNGIVVDDSTEPNPQTIYGKTKLEAELVLSKAPFPVTIARISNVFGIGCRPFYNSVIATWMHLAYQGQSLHADERAYRDMIWVEDVVRFLISADSPGIAHIASGHLTPLVNMAAQVAKWAGVDMIRYDRGETGPVWHKPQVVTPVFEALRIYWDAVRRSN